MKKQHQKSKVNVVKTPYKHVQNLLFVFLFDFFHLIYALEWYYKKTNITDITQNLSSVVNHMKAGFE